MPYERTGYAPWSLTREAGVQSATVDGTIQVPQYIQPVLSTGFIDETGNWKGTKSSDIDFTILGTELAVPNGQDILAPGGDTPFIDIIAIKTTRSGNVDITSVMGPDTERFANLTPVNPASQLRGVGFSGQPEMRTLFNDDSEALTADVWNILYIGANTLADQKLLQFKITNNAGGDADIQFAFMRTI